MKKLFVALVVVGVLGVSGVQNSFAEMIEMKNHRDWVSGIIKVEDVSISRMVTITQEKDTLLIVDFVPGQCGDGIPRIAVIYKDAKKNSFKEKWIGSARVDNREIYNTEFTVIPDDGSIVLYIDGVQGQSIFRDAIQGTTVRFKIDIPGKKSAYIKFSLIGFRSAYERAQTLCKIMKENKKDNDEKYFPKNEDEKYFKKDETENEKNTKKLNLSDSIEKL